MNSEWSSGARWLSIKSFMDSFAKRCKDPAACKREASALAEAFDFAKASGRFFFSESAMRERAKAVERAFPDARRELLKTAELCVAHRFDILNSGLRSFGEAIDWNCDVKSGYRWDPAVEIFEAADPISILIVRDHGAELKSPWDLSNMHWLPTLACAWLSTGDKRFLRAIESDVASWIDSNSPFTGVNWFCGMNVGIRAVNVVFALAACRSALDEAFLRKALSSLQLHGMNIAAHLEISPDGSRNNHYLSCLIGLFFLGVLFQDSEDGRKWLRFAKDELELEADCQFRPDGVCFEDSTSYHRLSTEILLLCALLGETASAPFSSAFKTKLRAATLFTEAISLPDGSIPMVGDNDNGRILALSGYMTRPCFDHRHLLALGGEFLDLPSCRAAGSAAGAEALWLLGSFRPGVPASGELAAVAFKDSGFFVWKSSELSLLVHNGGIAKGAKGGHTHCDALSVCLGWKGEPLLVDAANYVYSSDFDARNAFRSTAYHNTIQLDDAELNEFSRKSFADLWSMKDSAKPETPVFSATAFKGRVESFVKSHGALVERELLWDAKASVLRVNDLAKPSGEKRSDAVARSRFLLAPGVSVRAESPRAFQLLRGGRVVAEMSFAQGVSASLRTLWFAPQYGERVPAMQIELSWRVVASEGSCSTSIALV